AGAPETGAAPAPCDRRRDEHLARIPRPDDHEERVVSDEILGRRVERAEEESREEEERQGPAERMVGSHLAPASCAFPLRRPLVEEGVHPFAEVAAHVAHEDEILGFLAREPLLQAAQPLLRRAQRERRVSRDELRELLGAALERGEILDELAD